MSDKATRAMNLEGRKPMRSGWTIVAACIVGLAFSISPVFFSTLGLFIKPVAAEFGWGRTQLAPRISPNKTVEGLLTGIAGGTIAFWLFGLGYQHEWFHGTDRLVIGLAVALTAPLGEQQGPKKEREHACGSVALSHSPSLMPPSPLAK